MFKKIFSIILAVAMVSVCSISSMAMTPFETETLKTTIGNGRSFEIGGFTGASVWGKDSAGEWVTYSFSDKGFHVFLNTGQTEWPLNGIAESGTEEDIIAMAYDFADENKVQKFNDLELEVDIVKQGEYATFIYKIHNPTNSQKTFSLATTGDVEVAGNDSADLVLINNGQGVKMINPDKNIIFVMNASTDTPIDNSWVGNWGHNYFKHMFEDMDNDASYTTSDSAFCISWVERTIKANETLTYSAQIEINENTAPTIAFDGTNDIVSKVTGKVFDRNIGSVKVFYAIDNGETQIIEGLTPNGTQTPFDIDVSSFECGSTHTIKAYACDDNDLQSSPVEITITISHSYDGTVTTEPTCTETGVKTLVCNKCEDTKTETIPATGHSFDEGTVIKEATCTAKGEKEFTCTVCEHKKVEEIELAEHSFGEGVITKEPTCTEKGIKEYTCSVCGEKKTEEIPMIAHTFKIREDGTEDTKCNVCGYEKPTEPTTEPSTKPSDTNNPTDKPNDNAAGKDDTIPNTGSSSVAIVAFGVLALGITGVIIAKSKKKETENK